MKFKTKEDAQLFVIEVGRVDLVTKVDENYEPGDEIREIFIKKRRGLVSRLKDFRKSQNTKKQWRENRYKIMKGIKSFHKSIKGKKLHRSMARFLATREFGKKREAFDWENICEFMKGLSSLKTHVFIEGEYMHSLEEELSFRIFVDEALGTINRVEKNILHGEELADDDYEFILRIVESSALIKSLAEKTGKTVEEIENMWEKYKTGLQKDMSIDDPMFYGTLVNTLKRSLGLMKGNTA